MSISLADLLFALVIFQLLMLSFLLFTSKGRRTSNTLLGAFFLSICLNLADVFLFRLGVYFNYPTFAGWGNSLPLVFGPLLYFYTRSVIYKNFTITLKWLLHFLPFFAFFLITEVYYLAQPNDIKESILKNLASQHLAPAFTYVSAVVFIQFFAYAFASIQLVAWYKKTSSQLTSSPLYTNVSWLYSTLVFFILVMVITTLNSVFAQTALAKYYLFIFNIVILAVLVFVIQVLMKALRQSRFFAFDEQELRASPSREITDPVERQEKEQIVEKLMLYMHSDKPYLEPELSLAQLAAQLSLKPRALSEAINDIRQQNFFDFINRYRIEEATRLLTNPEDKKITVLEVLYQVGFNSKSSFNTLFKKYTGITPTEFRKNQEH